MSKKKIEQKCCKHSLTTCDPLRRSPQVDLTLGVAVTWLLCLY